MNSGKSEPLLHARFKEIVFNSRLAIARGKIGLRYRRTHLDSWQNEGKRVEIHMVIAQRYYTPEEYLELEVNSQERHEYIDGRIIPMTGGTPNHNQITGNFYAALNFSLKRQPYRVFVTDQRLWIPNKQIHTYPDVIITARELEFEPGRKDTIVNPVMIAEVLSKSTRSYDRDQKFAAYRSIPSFQEYLLIEQYTMHIEQYYKTDNNRWTFTEYNAGDESICLNSVPFEIVLADIYDRVDFDLQE